MERFSRCQSIGRTPFRGLFICTAYDGGQRWHAVRRDWPGMRMPFLLLLRRDPDTV